MVPNELREAGGSQSVFERGSRSRCALELIADKWAVLIVYALSRGIMRHNQLHREIEVISCGFWAGDQNVREPAFYSYTAPEPMGLTNQPLRPEAAHWLPEGGMALLTYEEVRNSASSKDTLMEFLQSAYEAGAKSANWDIEHFRARPVR